MRRMLAVKTAVDNSNLNRYGNVSRTVRDEIRKFSYALSEFTEPIRLRLSLIAPLLDQRPRLSIRHNLFVFGSPMRVNTIVAVALKPVATFGTSLLYLGCLLHGIAFYYSIC